MEKILYYSLHLAKCCHFYQQSFCDYDCSQIIEYGGASEQLQKSQEADNLAQVMHRPGNIATENQMTYNYTGNMIEH